MDTSILSQELEPLNAQIDELQKVVVKLEGELRVVEEELETYATEQQQFDILQDACNALDRLQEMGAGELFWDGLPEGVEPNGHSERLRQRIAAFEESTRDIQQKRSSLQKSINQKLDDLDFLFDEVQQAYAREERRLDEFAIDREVSYIPYQPMLMPWSKNVENERCFRRSLLIAMFWCLLFGFIIPLITVPVPDRTTEVIEIPERLAMLVKKEPPIPAPVPIPEKPPEEKKIEPDKEKPAETKKAPEKKQPKPDDSGTKVARKKAESTGVLAFKSSFEDLMDEVPVAKLGLDARLKKANSKAPGQAVAHRSLVALEGKGGGSGGISSSGISRDLGYGGNGGGSGYGKIGGVGFAKVESSLADLTAEEGRPLSDGPGPGRTDEEIQIVFDRYKASLYRIYNRELRNDPTLRGKLLLRIIIEPGGEVSLCKVESTDLGSQELVAKIVERVKRFNFGAKDDVPKTTILYPIDFLPAG